MAEGVNEPPLEGFLCPLCMKDLKDIVQLQVHFEEVHSKEDAAFVKSLKDLFSKAKSAVTSSEEAVDEISPQPRLRLAPERTDIDPVSGVRRDLFPPYPSPSVEAPSRSYLQEFKKTRGARVDRYATETNRLVVRLDKLLRDMPGDPSRRRDHERAVVAWIDEDLVKLCPTCASKFNPLRRKHHCRLCGSVMCHDCSQWVDWDLCRRLISPAALTSYKPQPERVSGRDSRDTRSMGSPGSRQSLFRLKRTSSRESLASSSSGLAGGRGQEEFRACEYCKKLLTYREKQLELQNHRPIVSQFYESLSQYVTSGEQLSPKYLTMHESLMRGEPTYNLDDAKLLRVRLLKIAENIDLMSKRIESLGRENYQGGPEEPLPRRFKLQAQIRRAAVLFIKDTLVGLPSLPSVEEAATLQRQRQEEMKRQAEEERHRAAEAKLKFQRMQEKKRSSLERKTSDVFKLPSPGFPTAPNFVRSGSFRNKVSHDQGFVVSSSNQEANSVNDDPMVQQMNNLRGYIKQAREANMFDEVSMLESNLKMLQEEFKRQKTEREEELRRGEEEEALVPNGVDDMSLEESNPFSTPSSSNPFGESDISGPPSLYRPSFNETTKELDMEDTSNPFGEDKEDEYDSSGKNPFAE